MRITFENEIAAPVPVVWSCLDDDTTLPLWMPEVVEISYPEGQKCEDPVGAAFRQTLKEGGREKTYDGLVTAYEPERQLGVRQTDRRFGVDLGYALSPTAQGTRLH